MWFRRQRPQALDSCVFPAQLSSLYLPTPRTQTENTHSTCLLWFMPRTRHHRAWPVEPGHPAIKWTEQEVGGVTGLHHGTIEIMLTRFASKHGTSFNTILRKSVKIKSLFSHGFAPHKFHYLRLKKHNYIKSNYFQCLYSRTFVLLAESFYL